MSQFFTLPTKIGQGLISNAIAYNEPLTIATMAIGDGGGKLPAPDASVTRLVNEVRRGPINQITTDPDNPNWIIVEQVLPPDVGGWTIREVGLYDTDDNLIAYGNYPETYKPQLSEGSSRTQTIRFVMEVTDTGAVTLKIDPSVVMASRDYVDKSIEAHAKSRNHPYADTTNQGMVKFATLTTAKTGTDTKTALTPAGGTAQIAAHRTEEEAHTADLIVLAETLGLFGGADNVQTVLAMLGAASKSGVGHGSGLDADTIDGKHADSFAAASDFDKHTSAGATNVHKAGQIALNSTISQASGATNIQEALAALGQFAGAGYQNIAVFDQAGVHSFSVPDDLSKGLRRAHITVTGAGGGGSKNDGQSGSGGGEGGTAIGVIDLTGIKNVSVTVGTGGDGGSINSGSQTGMNGGASSFGQYISASGGGGASLWTAGAGGSGSGGDLNFTGAPGAAASDHASAGRLVAGSGGGSGGGRGTSSANATAGDSGRGIGGGGAGGIGSGIGGAGYKGIVIIRW